MRRHKVAFTLVELLVVVAILSLLLSLLVPSLARSKELVRRAICASNMKTTIGACQQYAAEWREALPPSQNATGAEWSYAFDARKSVAPYDKSYGVGLCVDAKTLQEDQLGQLLHCPSLDTSAVGPAPNCGYTTPWHSMNVLKSNWWSGAGAGWWSDPSVFKVWRMVIAYNYRSPSWFRTHAGQQIRSSALPSYVVLYADVLDPRFGGRYAHRDGHNIIRADSSGTFFSVDQERIEAIAVPDGNPCTDGVQNPAQDEQIFQLFEQPN